MKDFVTQGCASFGIVLQRYKNFAVYFYNSKEKFDGIGINGIGRFDCFMQRYLLFLSLIRTFALRVKVLMRVNLIWNSFV